ncbi:hypothetical protein GLA29479_1744 [Lysobacter antibioticus]|nr:hypothetical protein GLA29479_1744 [Lysobacter antibioticus]
MPMRCRSIARTVADPGAADGPAIESPAGQPASQSAVSLSLWRAD